MFATIYSFLQKSAWPTTLAFKVDKKLVWWTILELSVPIAASIVLVWIWSVIVIAIKSVFTKLIHNQITWPILDGIVDWTVHDYCLPIRASIIFLWICWISIVTIRFVITKSTWIRDVESRIHSGCRNKCDKRASCWFHRFQVSTYWKK